MGSRTLNEYDDDDDDDKLLTDDDDDDELLFLCCLADVVTSGRSDGTWQPGVQRLSNNSMGQRICRTGTKITLLKCRALLHKWVAA